jgi:hypothetical protein
MPDVTKRQQLVIKAEATPGTAETLESGTGLSAGAVMVLADEIKWTPGNPAVERAAAGASFDTAGSITSFGAAKISFKSDLRGLTTAFSSSNLPDNALPLRACGLNVAFSGGAGSEIITITPLSKIPTWYTLGKFNDGRLFRIAGAVGNVTMNFVSGDKITLEYEFQGAYVDPFDVALRTTGLAVSTPAPPIFRAAAASVLGFATPRFKTLTFNLGNQISLRGDPNATSAILTADLVGRTIACSIDPEVAPIGTKNYWGEWTANTTGIITTGTFPSTGTQYNKINLTFPKAKPRNVDNADRDGFSIAPYEFEAQRNSDAGDDSFSLVIS